MTVSAETAKAVGDTLNVNWDVVSEKWWKKGLEVELEHGSKISPATNVTHDDLVTTGRIALAHLYEDPDYYRRLERMEQEGDKFWHGKVKPSPVRGGIAVTGGFAKNNVAPFILVLLLIILVVAVTAVVAKWGARYYYLLGYRRHK